MVPDPASWRPVERRIFLFGVAVSGIAVAGPRTANARQRKADNAEKNLRYHSHSPNNAEPVLAELVKSWITPYENFYIRTHGPNPTIDEKAFTLSVEGLVRKPRKLTLGHIREGFSQETITATMTCAGNRRQEHSETKPVGGVPWGAGAIGNATWTGVPLAEILKHAEVQEGAKHVWFEGADQVDVHGQKTPFGGSIPFEKAMAVHGKTPGALVAWKMNAEPLRPDHGFPVRTVVPGYIGARSVKWLGKIVVSDRPSPNHFVAEAYKIVTEETPEQLAQAKPIYHYPINSAIAKPMGDREVPAGRVVVHGYALPPGEPGRTIQRVEVSSDGGKTWRDARLDEQSAPFCWRFWTAEIELADATTLIARATDSAGQRQPQTTPWNIKGYLYNGWHGRMLKVKPG